MASISENGCNGYFKFDGLTSKNLIQLLFLTLKALISTISVKNHHRSSFFGNIRHPEMNFCLFSIHWPLFQRIDCAAIFKFN